MNILILSWRGPNHPNAGGAEISTHEHAKGWVSAGHNVTLFTSDYGGGKEKETMDGVKIIRAGYQVFGVHWRAFFWYLFSYHEKFDLVVDQFHGISFFTPLYVRNKKLAFIHEVAKEVWSLNHWPKPFNLIPASLGRIFEPMIFIIYGRVPFMTVSNSTKNDLEKWGIPSKNITIIHNGANPPKIKIPAKERKKTLIFLGVLSKDKGIEDALKIFAQLKRVDKDWRFWVVGKPDSKYTMRLKEIVKNEALERSVKFWGYVNPSLKYQLLAKSHLLINTSVREGWGLVVIEAASVGTPTVAFNVPGLRDSIVDGKTGILCSKNNMAEKIISLLKDDKTYQKMRQSAISWSKKFSWNSSTKKSLRLINSLMKRE